MRPQWDSGTGWWRFSVFEARGIIMRLLHCILIAAIVAGLSAPLLADTVHLRDGRKIVGQIVMQSDDTVVAVETSYGRLEFRASEVEKIEYDSGPKPTTGGPDKPTGPITTSTDPATAPARPAVSATSQADPETATLSTAERDLFVHATGEADKAMTAAEGLAVWTRFKADHPAGPLADLAKARVALWQTRWDKDQVRFGTTWLAQGG